MISAMPDQDRTTPEAPHDVLAADEFAVPAPDPELHYHGPVQLPEDPTGEVEPHDVLAAEEFPMPAPRRSATALADRRGGYGRLLAEVAAAVLLALVIGRRRRP